MHLLHPDLSLALQAARTAGESIRAAFGSDQEVTYKSRNQPVSEVDLEADRIIREMLLSGRPGYGWVSEESMPAGEIPTDRPCWVVDPLDGSSNFLAGDPGFAVSIGLLERGTPVLGVVYNPMADRMYHGALGVGAYIDGSPHSPEPRPSCSGVIVVSPQERRRGLLRGLGGHWHMEELGSTTLKIMRVVEGGADAYASAGVKGIWDVCAAHAIAGEAGTVLVHGNGGPISYRTAGDRVDGLLALSGSTLDSIPDLVERLKHEFTLPPEEQN